MKYTLYLTVEVYNTYLGLQSSIEEKLGFQIKPYNPLARSKELNEKLLQKPVETISFEAVIEKDTLKDLIYDWLMVMEELAVDWSVRKPFFLNGEWLFLGGVHLSTYYTNILLPGIDSIGFQFHSCKELESGWSIRFRLDKY